jgi:hypothetical protein
MVIFFDHFVAQISSCGVDIVLCMIAHNVKFVRVSHDVTPEVVHLLKHALLLHTLSSYYWWCSQSILRVLSMLNPLNPLIP